MKILNAENLKNDLWETFQLLKSGDILSSQANAMEGQARGILKTVNVQLSIQRQSGRVIPAEVLRFSEELAIDS